MNKASPKEKGSVAKADIANEINEIYRSYNNKNIVLEELIGLRVSVYKSVDQKRAGIKGHVFKETKNILQIKCKDGSVKTIPKKGATFKFHILKNSFKVKGEEIGFRSYERTKKSLKFYRIRKNLSKQVH